MYKMPKSSQFRKKCDNKQKCVLDSVSIWRMRTLMWLSVVWQVVRDRPRQTRRKKNGLPNLPARIYANAPYNQGIYNGLCIDHSSCGMYRSFFWINDKVSLSDNMA